MTFSVLTYVYVYIGYSNTYSPSRNWTFWGKSILCISINQSCFTFLLINGCVIYQANSCVKSKIDCILCIGYIDYCSLMYFYFYVFILDTIFHKTFPDTCPGQLKMMLILFSSSVMEIIITFSAFSLAIWNKRCFTMCARLLMIL